MRNYVFTSILALALAIVPAAGLEAVARAYAKIIDQVNTLDRSSLMPTAPKATSNRQGQ